MQPPRVIPGLKEDEAEVMRSYLSTIPNTEVRAIEFNARLGDGITFTSGPPEVQRMAKMITQLRADAVIFFNDYVLIVESKLRATSQAIGQLLTYRDLWMKTHPGAPPPRLAIVCYDIHPDIMTTARLNEIELITVKEASHGS